VNKFPVDHAHFCVWFWLSRQTDNGFAGALLLFIGCMSAVLDLNLAGAKDWAKTNRCSIVSIYENLGGRDLLLKVCGSLAAKFRGDLEFQFDWCRVKYLADPDVARETALKAGGADLILLAAQSPSLAADMQSWLERWVPRRLADDGSLVLVQPSPTGTPSLPLGAYLRLTAKGARIDRTSLLQSDLTDMEEDDRPMHWGINE
jgi:hypothetical protein